MGIYTCILETQRFKRILFKSVLNPYALNSMLYILFDKQNPSKAKALHKILAYHIGNTLILESSCSCNTDSMA